MRGILIAFCLLLGACQPKAISTPVTVEIPMRVPCKINAPVEPQWLSLHAKNADIQTQTRAITVDLDNAFGYIEELEAAIQSCQ